MNYLEWNDAIGAHFFRPEMADRRVFLAVTDDVIQDIGKAHGVGKDDFLCAIRTGPPWTLGEPDICRNALAAKTKWRERNLPYPPYIAFLAVFVLAASSQDGFAPQSYYSPLSVLLGQTVGLKQFEPMHELWFDLRNWSRRDKEDTLGTFRPGIPAGSPYTNVGLPRAQTLLLSCERVALPRFFRDNHLDPTSLPSESALLRALSHAPFLRPSTRRILIDKSGRELQSALAGFVLDELQAWDGSIEEHTEGTSKGSRSIQTSAVVRLCLKINNLAGRVDVTARFKASRTFPDDPLNLRDMASGQVWIGRASQEGWSCSFYQTEDARKVILDATTLNWTDGQALRDAELGWRVALPPASVRLFLPGRREGLSDDWIEASHLVPGSPFCVACRSVERAAIEAWGGEHCETFCLLPVSGLPPDWSLFCAKNASRSLTNFDLLTLSSRRRLQLIGGIRAEGRYAFFHFNRPCIVLDGGDGTEKITCSQSPLTVDDNGLWTFSDAAPMDVRLRVECGEEALNLILRPTEVCPRCDAPPLDIWGALTDGAGVVRGVEAPEDDLQAPPVDIPTHFGGHIVFLGRRAGELADWPDDPLPHEWPPVWAIVKDRKDQWRAHFIGTSADFREVRQTKQGMWKKWREIYKRRTTEPVGIRRVRAFWTQCKKEAEQL